MTEETNAPAGNGGGDSVSKAGETQAREAWAQPAGVEYGRWLFAQECQFVAGATKISQLPPDSLREVAFAGRSNVGKSSLVNALTGRKTLARTSSNPGHTRQLNFFDLGGRVNLVDLPGYGYARASKGDIERWTSLTLAYLKGRPRLMRVCLLIDARHGVKPADEEIMSLLDSSAVSYQIVLTKADKSDAATLARIGTDMERLRLKHVALHPDLVVTSSRSGLGIEELRARLAALAEEAGQQEE